MCFSLVAKVRKGTDVNALPFSFSVIYKCVHVYLLLSNARKIALGFGIDRKHCRCSQQ